MKGMKHLALAFALPLLLMSAAPAGATDPQYRTADGLAIYLGVVPAGMVQRVHPPDHVEAEMHGGVPRGRHVQHVMVAVFDAATGERIEDAKVEARVTPLGLARVRRALEPMDVAGTITYGNYFTMRGEGPYRIEILVTPAGTTKPVTLTFVHEHRARR